MWGIDLRSTHSECWFKQLSGGDWIEKQWRVASALGLTMELCLPPCVQLIVTTACRDQTIRAKETLMRTCLIVIPMFLLLLTSMLQADPIATQPSEIAPEESGKQAATQAVIKPVAEYLYWLSSKEKGEYVVLLISTEPVHQLPGVKFDGTKTLSEATAIVVTTYAKDSIWNTDFHPFKMVESVTDIDLDKRELVLNGKKYQYVAASLHEVVGLLEHPRGTILIHRIYAPLAGAEAINEVLLSRFKAQLPAEDSKEPAAEATTQPTSVRQVPDVP